MESVLGESESLPKSEVQDELSNPLGGLGKRTRSRQSADTDSQISNGDEHSHTTKRTKTDNGNDKPEGGSQTGSTADNGGASNGNKKLNVSKAKDERADTDTIPSPVSDSSVGRGRRRASGRTKTVPSSDQDPATVSSDTGESKELQSTSRKDSSASTEDETGGGSVRTRIKERWVVHQLTEDYVDFVGRMMFPGTQFRPYGFDPDKGQYPLEGISALGFLKSPIRRPTVVERWSPYEVALFEAAMLHHGKEFHKVAREIGTKSTKDVIEFYYTWKKTAPYRIWKKTFVSEEEVVELETPKKAKRR